MNFEDTIIGKIVGVISIVFLGLVAIVIISFFIQILLAWGSAASTGSGIYTGILVETRHHGIFFKTDGAHFKTGENSSLFEDFCVTDKSVMHKLQNVPPNSKMVVSYKKLFSTPSWKCEGEDSSDIITDFKIIN